MSAINLILVHPSPLMGDILGRVIETAAFEPCTTSIKVHCVLDEAGLRQRLEEGEAAVVLLSYKLSGPCSTFLISRLARRARFMVFDTPAAEQPAVDCLAAGARAWIAAEASVPELISSIQSVLQGQIVCSPRVIFHSLQTLSSRSGSQGTMDCLYNSALTTREIEILYFVGTGLSNREIAQRLCVSVYTVKNHIHRILEKLRVRTRSDAARLAEAMRSIPSSRAVAS